MSPEGWREFHIDAAQLVWSGFFHLVYGPTAVVLMWPYFSGDVTPIRALGDWTALLADGDVEFIRLTEAGGLMGSIFGALMVDYLFYWAVGWDKGWTQLFHHATFFAVTLTLARRVGLPQSGLVAMAMEASSPALNLMNLLRQLEGPLREWRAHCIRHLLHAFLRSACRAVRCRRRAHMVLPNACTRWLPDAHVCSRNRFGRDTLARWLVATGMKLRPLARGRVRCEMYVVACALTNMSSKSGHGFD